MSRRRLISEEDVRQRLRRNVRRFRAAASLTAKQAAARVKMNLRHWQKIEAGEINVTLNTLAKVAQALGVDPADLLDDPERQKDKQR
jgi:transcriptional regulator with XRE-family HTH domain